MSPTEPPIEPLAAVSPRVSVVIPCHNSLGLLPETVDAVLGQSFRDLEVVLVDDGGDDDLAGWCESVADPRMRCVRQQNAGVSAARNLGISVSRGELVAFCDSDDVWVPHALDALVARYDEAVGETVAGSAPAGEVGLVYGWYQVADSEGVPTGRVAAYRIEGDAWEDLVRVNPVGASATLVPRAVLDSVGGFIDNRDRFPVDVEDWDLWLRIAQDHRLAVVPEVLYHYRRHDSNSSVAVDSLESAYRDLLERTFAGQPQRRQWLCAPATANMELTLGWQSLNDLGDAPRALRYRRSALRHFPGVRREVEYWRLGLAAGATRTFGQVGFRIIRNTVGRLRRSLGLRRS